ncbi:MAG: hypothetical protein J7647_14400 [Cyanobacteria bacterium SBLK]|nr:hypothetical protein [Cyanobacteria bacterium SBLK]
MTPDLALIGRSLAPLLTPTGRYIGRQAIGEEILERRKWRETALEPILQQAAEEVAETIEPLGKAEIDQICLFLTSPEAEAIVRQIYAASSLKDRQKDIDSIRQEFLLCFSLHTNIPETELEDSAPQIFDILLEGCEQALRIAIDAGKLSAHEARSEFRHRMVLDELAAIQKNLTFLMQNKQRRRIFISIYTSYFFRIFYGCLSESTL